MMVLRTPLTNGLTKILTTDLALSQLRYCSKQDLRLALIEHTNALQTLLFICEGNYFYKDAASL